jgi:maltoporin
MYSLNKQLNFFYGGLSMRAFRVIAVSIIACVTAAGAVFAADDPLEIHGGGRTGVVVNSKGGSQAGGLFDNGMGSMPNYGETRYWGLSISKKTTAEGGSWAKVSTYIDKFTADQDGDLQDQAFRMRDFHIDFGGLDFLPTNTVLWGGLKGNSAGGIGQQDYTFINFSGIGFGIEKLGGVLSLSYYGQDSGVDDNVKGLGERTMHNIVASVNVPLADVYAAYGISKKSDLTGEKNISNFYVGGVLHAPVGGLNLGAAYATNGYANEIYFGNSDTCLKGEHFSGSTAVVNDARTAMTTIANDKAQKLSGLALALWSITDIQPGLYIAPAISYNMLMAGKEAAVYKWKETGTDIDGDGNTDTEIAYALHKKNTLNKIAASLRISKTLTKNLALVPTFGYNRVWDKEKVDPKPLQMFQETLALEVALAPSFGAGQKLQFYATCTEVDKDHKGTKAAPGKLGEGYGGKTLRTDFGMLVTFGF